MDANQPLSLLAGLSPAQFMRRHWQKKPLVIRQAFPGFVPPVSRSALFKMATQEHVESRLIVREKKTWRMTHGPLSARSLPPLSQNGWTLLVQGVDLHSDAAHELLQQFRFVPDARLDDLMISFATAGGGVGAHFDSYDVFLFQASGRRRWKIGRQKDLTLQPGAPLKLLAHFEPEEEFVLEAGDMLYLPPRYAHDGLAEASMDANGKAADCMTYSIGFRAPSHAELGGALLHRLAEYHEEADGDDGAGDGPAVVPVLYRDAGQSATANPAAMPIGLEAFARKAVLDALQDPLALPCALGEYMTEVKPSVWFGEDGSHGHTGDLKAGIRLNRCTRMMYDEHHVFINGESYRAKGADARLMRELADTRRLAAAAMRKASPDALSLLSDWQDAGWVEALPLA